jgi:O-acetyl-ADP-ribose deacetylase (regulator of RNase III)
MTKITFVQGDIAKQEVDAIVNAANPSLGLGSGVNGAIHRVAGPELLTECQTLDGCLTGQAKLTKGYNLPATHVIHTVAPYSGDHHGQEEELLAHCYRSCLIIAKDNSIRTIAFPALGIGAYGNPKEASTEIALQTVKEWTDANPDALDEVRFVLFSEDVLNLYQSTWSSLP